MAGNSTGLGNATIPDSTITLPPGTKASYVEPTLTGADADWHALEVMLRQPRFGDSAGKNGEDLVREADKFKDFVGKYPDHAKASDAKCYEAILLLRAQLDGDTLNYGRVQSAVARSLHDKSATSQVRAEMFALADTVAILQQPGQAPKSILAAFERASRKVMAEFPDLPNGYDSLAAIANDSDDAEGAALAKEVAAMSAAPAHARAAAQKVVERFDLDGKSVVTLLDGVPNATSLLGNRQQPVFVYAWSAAVPGSMRRAQALADNVGSKVGLVGICLDTDVAGAKTAAATAKLPGTLIYDSTGAAGEIASRLKLSAPGLMYEIDSNGTIVSTATHLRLRAKNAAAP